MSQARDLEGDAGHDDLVSAPKMVLQGFIMKHLFNNCGVMSDQDMHRLLAQVRPGGWPLPNRSMAHGHRWHRYTRCSALAGP